MNMRRGTKHGKEQPELGEITFAYPGSGENSLSFDPTRRQSFSQLPVQPDSKGSQGGKDGDRALPLLEGSSRAEGIKVRDN